MMPQITILQLETFHCKGLREEGNNDWIWDWSSRPEVTPPSLENLPALLFTHACTFFLGAAAMLFYLKKYCNWAAVARQTIN
ncbi:hypothetical protein NP493_436g01045 [Ridgeia piscesae]|uniref:Uncharacterized protein n=1 Tax=Ridgeia piscesae TaxID=27915 RepID=A0AAD9KZK7_RIDPI|nr:hypothetical protein NP493_436g01045 [Ridgeia piscesae]